MKITVRRPDVDSQGNILLLNDSIERVGVNAVSVMSIDGSTTNTGIAILRESDGALFYSLAFEREKGETPVQYKVRLKKAVNTIILNNTLIEHIYYEEPFIGYATAAPNLMMLRTFVEELIVENEPLLNYIKHSEINNKRWKKLFLAPDKCPTGTDLEKAAVRKKLIGYMPYLKDVTQDEIDAISMGFIATVQIAKGLESDLESRKKPHAFQYNIRFIGAEDDDDMLLEFMDVYDGPKYLLDNGISMTDCKGTEDFNKHIYKEMLSDDKVLIIKFDSNKHGNLILQYKIGHLASTYPYIYAIVWRKSRK